MGSRRGSTVSAAGSVASAGEQNARAIATSVDGLLSNMDVIPSHASCTSNALLSSQAIKRLKTLL